MPLQVYERIDIDSVRSLAPRQRSGGRAFSWESDGTVDARARIGYGVGEDWEDPNADQGEPVEIRSEITGGMVTR